MERGYGTAVVVRLAGLTYDTLDYWARTGLLVPSITQATGKGSDRIYSFRDLVAARIIRELRVVGFPSLALEHLVAYVREAPDLDGFAIGIWLAITKDRVLVAKKDADLAEVLRHQGSGAAAPVINLGRIVSELRVNLAADSVVNAPTETTSLKKRAVRKLTPLLAAKSA